MPLLVKELAEQAGRIRTYRIRLAFALLLYVPAMAMMLFRDGNLDLFGSVDLASTGFGREVCDLVWISLQFAIYIFLPAMTAGCIASEKEDGSLPLLFLTDLKPSEIILQKYLGRLVPFLTLVLLSLPLFAVGYAYGGLSVDTVLIMGIGLLVAMLQVAAISLLCSAHCSTATAAIVSSYFVGAAIYFLPYLAVVILHEAVDFLHGWPDSVIECTLLAWNPFYVLTEYRHNLRGLLAASLPLLASTILFLVLARAALVKYVFSTPRSVVSLFRRLDGIYAGWNRHFGNRTFFADHATLPADQPIAWREMHKRGLGRRHHLVRLLLILMIPLVFLLVLYVLQSSNRRLEIYMMIGGGTWLVCGVILLTNAASCIPSERSAQTLDVLLSTPIDVISIVQQKLASLHRLAFVLSIPLLTLGVLPALNLLHDHWNRYEDQKYWLMYNLIYVTGTVTGLLYLLWIGFACGLFMRNRTAAVTTAIAAAVFLFAGFPLLVGFTFFGLLNFHEGPPFTLLFLLTPGMAIVGGVFHEAWIELFRDWECLAFAIWFVIAIVTLSTVRKKCLSCAPRILRGE